VAHFVLRDQASKPERASNAFQPPKILPDLSAGSWMKRRARSFGTPAAYFATGSTTIKDAVMSRITLRGALHITWTFPAVDTPLVNTLREHLAGAQQSGIFKLQSWDWRDGRASAVLTPLAPLEDIVAVIWGSGHHPITLRWWNSRP
jgi:hypothetical protein